MVRDSDFDAPLPAAQVQIVETGEKLTTSEEGNYVFGQVEPGRYTLVFSKSGYTRQVKTDVVVSPGQLTEVNTSLSGDFTEMDEFIVQDVQIGGGSEIALLELRLESPALIDTVGSELMSQAGASDAASALQLVAGATVQDGKFAVVRGLPDRYVNSQMNGVRLPTADADKRAVELDQFPAAAIESIQVSKTFTPDQQADASGGAVNVVLKSIPEEPIFKFSIQSSYNSQVSGGDDFLTYEGGGVDFWGRDDGDRDIQFENLGENWEGAVGVSRDEAPVDYKWSVAGGGKFDITQDIKFGAFGSFFYERDSSFFEDGIDDNLWVEEPGAEMTPQFSQGTPQQGAFKTSLFDVTRAQEEVKWGGLAILGIETKDHLLQVTNLYTRTTQDTATLAEDTRGKEYFFPGFDVNDPKDPGNIQRDAAPYLRTETLEYNERVTRMLQFSGKHTFSFFPKFGLQDFIYMTPPELDWYIATSSATSETPDKRQFGSQWWAESFNRGFPPFVPPSIRPAVHRPFKPAANFLLGNLQRTWEEITEESDQYAVNLKLPFVQWSGDEGFVKLGIFDDKVEREFDQESFSNFNDNSARFFGDFEDFWSAEFPNEDHAITAADVDVDYTGEQNINAWYYMVDFPLTSFLSVIGGVRFEDTEIIIINDPEEDVRWFPPGSSGAVRLNPGDADVFFEQQDELPSIGFKFTPFEELITLRGSYSETVARQTFKELTPIQQQEFLGGDVFIGNPELQMSAVENYDLRLDFTPYKGSLFSVSYFKKDVLDPIEFVQRVAEFTFTTPVNFPEGTLSGYEFEFRQEMGRLWKRLEGLTLRGNATLIDSEVTLPEEEQEALAAENIQAPQETRPMTNAPEHLYNLSLTYELGNLNLPLLTDTTLGVFYTVRGDTLVAGAGQSKGNFVPDVFETEFGTLNVSLTKNLGEHFSVKFQAKNILNPDIETVFRSEFIGDDVTKTSYQRGREYSISLSYSF